MKNSIFGALSSVLVRCDTIHDQLFDVHIPQKVFVKGAHGSSYQQDLFATAHRCMNNWCFLKPARAYVLGLFVDHAALNRLKAHPTVCTEDVFRTDCPKSFVLFFASSKDIKHIRRGFMRSFETFIKTRPELPLSLISRFLAVLDGTESLARGDFIRVSCQPATKTLTVAFNDTCEIVIPNADGLIDWIHSLYVGLESTRPARYASMQQKLRLAKPTVD
jgi:hypothetical protein